MKAHLFLISAFAATVSTGSAGVALFDYAFNIDGTVSDIFLVGDPVPAAADVSLFDDTTGLGTISVTLTGAGAHHVGLFVDHETPPVFSDESGSVSGAPAAGQSWEIDEPQLTFGPIGDIFDNFAAGTPGGGSALDNAIFSSAGGAVQPNDVAMAQAWDFSLAAGQTGRVDFFLTDSPPTTGGLVLKQSDSDGMVYFTSALTISGGGAIPEASQSSIVLLGALGMALHRRRKRRTA